MDHRYPVSSTVGANLVRDLTENTSMHIGFNGLGLLGRSEVDQTAEVGITVSF